MAGRCVRGWRRGWPLFGRQASWSPLHSRGVRRAPLPKAAEVVVVASRVAAAVSAEVVAAVVQSTTMDGNNCFFATIVYGYI